MIARTDCSESSNVNILLVLTENDPKHCGDPKCELACENNTTLIYFNSHKYLVRSINYSNYTIRLTDAAIGNDICSFPNYSLSGDDFGNGYPYSIRTHRSLRHMYDGPDITSFITFINCPYPVNNSVFLLEAAAHCFNESINRRRTYIKIGDLNGSYVMDMCTIDLILMTSLLGLKDEKNVSFSDIHSSLLYGFELSWFNVLCSGKCKNCFFDGKRATCEGYDRCYVGLYWSFPCDITWIIDLCIEYGAWLQLALRIIIGLPCVLWLLIYKLRRRHLSTFDIIEGFLRSNNNLMPIRKASQRPSCSHKSTRKPRASGQDFINEVATIGRIHHVNVVKLVGYCAERSKRAVVYDFMPNGSLEKYIFTQQRPNYSLSWQRKYEIAVGVARGIEYLHRGWYVAPELINRSIGGISSKTDVYSFGMLLMEMVGLKRDIMMSPVDRPSMSEVVKMLESENGNLQIPPRPSESLQIESYSDQTWEMESAGSMALLADDASNGIIVTEQLASVTLRSVIKLWAKFSPIWIDDGIVTDD
ncbi:hypothetical protein DH2020_027612 [Rehmannia glutinosa]|uniref:Protein kinase domain-containing protein n=1 Tax=Rehmannia glutinosa TaxID=99300 RepID=A0ABR0VXT2_REHGL